MITTETRITATIDWLSVTSGKITHPAWMYTEHTDLERGMLNYDTGVKYSDGRIELWHSRRENMKSHLIMSGETLTSICSIYGKSIWDILTAYSYARPSRIDVAVDVINGTLDMARMANDVTAKLVTTRATGGMYLSNIGEDEGETLYVGSTAGNRRLRVYDKASESGLDGDWTRIELQTRQRQAVKSKVALMTRLNDVNAIPELILSFADWSKYPDWAIVMGTEHMSLSRLEVPKHARRDWILDTVAKVIAKEIIYGSGQSIIGDLLDMVGVELDVLKSKIKH